MLKATALALLLATPAHAYTKVVISAPAMLSADCGRTVQGMNADSVSVFVLRLGPQFLMTTQRVAKGGDVVTPYPICPGLHHYISYAIGVAGKSCIYDTFLIVPSPSPTVNDLRAEPDR